MSPTKIMFVITLAFATAACARNVPSDPPRAEAQDDDTRETLEDKLDDLDKAWAKARDRLKERGKEGFAKLDRAIEADLEKAREKLRALAKDGERVAEDAKEEIEDAVDALKEKIEDAAD